jgi:hypothetical protein
MRSTRRAPDASCRGSPRVSPDGRRAALGALAFSAWLVARTAFGAIASTDVAPTGASVACDDPAAARIAVAGAAAPRVILVQGSLPFVTMDSLAGFLIAMGYPEERLRDPRDGGFTTSGYVDSVKLAGIVAWHVERDGMPPILIGHSRGGMVVIRTLHELAGAFQAEIPVWDPMRDEPLDRTTIVDPRSGASRPVVGLAVHHAVAIATGKLPRLLLGQWSMLRRVREVPDTVDDFTGFAIEGDLIADGVLGREPYVPLGRARVRNVTLPGSTSHVEAVALAPLAADPAAHAWIDAYRPDRGDGVPVALAQLPNILAGAELWYGVRRAWCEESRARATRGPT